MLNIELKKSIDEYIKYHFVNVTQENGVSFNSIAKRIPRM